MEDAAQTPSISIHDEMRPLHNHICIVHDEWMGRLVGIHEDAMDLYYRIRLRESDRLRHGGREEVYMTCVGACETLQGVERYDRIEANFTRQGCPPADEFMITTADRAENLGYGNLSMVDGRHADCDRVEISDRDPRDPIWWVVVRDLQGAIIAVEENDVTESKPIEKAGDATWEDALTLRVVARGGGVDDARRAFAIATATDSVSNQEYPEYATVERRQAGMERYDR